MSYNENITRIKAVHDALGELKDQVVFVGGATVSLYADRPATESRPTEDVDIVVELYNYADYAALENTLRMKGFENDRESGVLCRYRINGIIVDVMASSEDVLGFSNRWYPEAVKQSNTKDLGSNYTVRIFTSPYFVATKLEAFKHRGEGDGRFSSDFEDIVYILNNRSSIWDEIKHSDEAVRSYLINEFKSLLKNSYLDEWISAHLEYHERRRVDFVVNSIRELVE
ncbi:nucleotidyl transferase AbiEii/AbiGii toxin family protein [Pinibacter aurantiacus]|uniref:Nucleotidyl transferase AbiEii/AbiGii toxin family protein n=1 Tax=Pinibacter aurantiacus TaxID=2851599 RepID=A0A9E2SCL9_9BACT|nr:nucleotidyl transferase AbiEii/AbiGii toxin family protein [Pinibacter aurantiacus]MBV4359064.1 nucleotidyl transferase AbiEii/AbiGii toxin family protein [Pinibacter aurantiacus]